VTLLFNPLSGKGRAEGLTSAAARALSALGHVVTLLPTHVDRGLPNRTPAPGDLDETDLLVVVGGDGTLHRVLPALAHSHAAVYHVPAGTENLFARGFGMTSDALLPSVEAWNVVRMDLGRIGETWFALMVSAGPDASIIHRLSDGRVGPITHLSYARPMLREICDTQLPRLTVHVDGERVIERKRGILILANSKEYGLGMNPARLARMDDGLLDLVFLPADSIADAGIWGLRLLTNRSPCEPVGAISRRGTKFEVDSPDRCPFQADGEALRGYASQSNSSNRVWCTPGALLVLCTVQNRPK
jgi:diacylglycerol kinase (ATP)